MRYLFLIITILKTTFIFAADDLNSPELIYLYPYVPNNYKRVQNINSAHEIIKLGFSLDLTQIDNAGVLSEDEKNASMTEIPDRFKNGPIIGDGYISSEFCKVCTFEGHNYNPLVGRLVNAIGSTTCTVFEKADDRIKGFTAKANVYCEDRDEYFFGDIYLGNVKFYDYDPENFKLRDIKLIYLAKIAIDTIYYDDALDPLCVFEGFIQTGFQMNVDQWLNKEFSKIEQSPFLITHNNDAINPEQNVTMWHYPLGVEDQRKTVGKTTSESMHDLMTLAGSGGAAIFVDKKIYGMHVGSIPDPNNSGVNIIVSELLQCSIYDRAGLNKYIKISAQNIQEILSKQPVRKTNNDEYRYSFIKYTEGELDYYAVKDVMQNKTLRFMPISGASSRQFPGASSRQRVLLEEVDLGSKTQNVLPRYRADRVVYISTERDESNSYAQNNIYWSNADEIDLAYGRFVMEKNINAPFFEFKQNNRVLSINIHGQLQSIIPKYQCDWDLRVGSKSMNFTIEGFDPIEMDGYTHYKPFVVNDLNQIIEGSRYKIISKNLINLEDALLPAVMLV